jgi:hypothetical protein
MKKIIFLSLIAIIAVMFSACENDQIDIKKVYPARQIYPAPYTTWGASVAETRSYMTNLPKEHNIQLFADIENGTDGWYFWFYGADYDKKTVFYQYYFKSATTDLYKAIVGLSNKDITLDVITTQLENQGYTYSGFDKGIHNFKSSTTQVQVQLNPEDISITYTPL